MDEHPFVPRIFVGRATRYPGAAARGFGATAIAAVLLAAACGGSDSGGDATARNAPTYTVGGQIAGLDEGFVELRNGLDRKRIDANPNGLGLDAPFRFDAALPAGAGYAVQITSDPMAQFALQCDVVNGSGTVGSAPVDNVLVRCARVKSLRLLAGVPTLPPTQDGLANRVGFGVTVTLAGDATGNVFVADRTAIRRITPLGIVTTIAGSATSTGTNDGSASEARFTSLSGLAADATGNLLAFDNATLRRITAAGVVTTLAGSAAQVGSADGAGAAARFGSGGAIAFDADGNAYVADTDNHTVRRVTPAGVVTTIAGSAAVPGTADGTGAAARFTRPAAIAFDRAGNFVVADTGSHTVRRVTPGGAVTTIAGVAGTAGFADGPALAATFSFPSGVAVDRAGNVFVASDTTIRRLTPAGVVSTFAGTAQTSGSTDGTGTAARFTGPGNLLFGNDGFVYAADSTGDETLVRRIGPEAQVTTFAGVAERSSIVDGTGSQARFREARGVAVDDAGTVYVADTTTVRRVSPLGVVSTIAGADDGGASAAVDGNRTTARFAFLQGIARDASGNLFVTDRHAIRRITPAGDVTTLAGVVDLPGPADGTGSAARFRNPRGLATDAAGNLYVADTGNYTVRRVTPAGVVTTLAGTAGTQGTADGTGAVARFNFDHTGSITGSALQFVSGGIGVAVDASGVVFVADSRAVRRITAGGQVTTVATSTTGRLSGIAVLPNGSLYVANANDCVVQLLLPTVAGYVAETVAGSASVRDVSLGALPATIGPAQGIVVFGKRVYAASRSTVLFFDR